MHRLTTIYFFSVALTAAVLLTVGCSQSDVTQSATPDAGDGAAGAADQPVAVAFDSYLQRTGQGSTTRATYPATALGPMTNERLQATSFGVMAQYTGNTGWTGYGKGTPFNFMWNQQVTWDAANSVWTYTPVKYWPNDNQPADDQTPPAQGAQVHSYLQFFAYAPYVNPASLPGTEAGNDGILYMSDNSANIGASCLYYRTSNENPFGVEESVDLLWAKATDRYKTDPEGYGYVGGTVPLVFQHALSKVSITAKALIDRTGQYSSDAYSTEVDGNTRIFIESADITTPKYYSEGMLKFSSAKSTPVWDYTGLDAKKKTGFSYDADDRNSTEDVKYSMRYAAPNVPTKTSITDSDSDGLDDDTGLTLVETARAAFDAMEEGVTATEQQLSATHSVYLFPPGNVAQAISVHVVYHVVTFDPNLTLNAVPCFSDVTNDITATLGDASFKFEPNKQYKLVLNLGLTSAKFDVYLLNDAGEYILLSSVVKEWDVKTTEVNVE